MIGSFNPFFVTAPAILVAPPLTTSVVKKSSSVAAEITNDIDWFLTSNS